MGSWWCWAVGATNTIRVVTRPSPQSAKPEAEPQGDSREQLPILADMILYYCRFATRPVLLQLYQTEVSKGLSTISARGKVSSAWVTNVGPTWGEDVGMAQPPRAGEAELGLLLFSWGPLHVSSQRFGWCCWLRDRECRSCPDSSQLTQAVFHPNTIPHHARGTPGSADRSFMLLEVSAFQQAPPQSPFSIPAVCPEGKFSLAPCLQWWLWQPTCWWSVKTA